MRWVALACLSAGCVQLLGASDPTLGAPPTPIQLIMGPASDPGHIALGATVELHQVIVTGVQPLHNTIFVQEPQGVAAAGHPYPEFAATRAAFASVDFTFPAVGDCVDIDGTVALFQGSTEVTGTAFTAEDTAACGAAPQPLAIPSTNPAVTFSDLQSQVSPTGGSAPGPLAANFEQVLVSFTNVQITTAPDTSANHFFFFQQQSATMPVVEGSGFIMAPPNLTVGANLGSITGVYSVVSNHFELCPRTADDYKP